MPRVGDQYIGYLYACLNTSVYTLDCIMLTTTVTTPPVAHVRLRHRWSSARTLGSCARQILRSQRTSTLLSVKHRNQPACFIELVHLEISRLLKLYFNFVRPKYELASEMGGGGGGCTMTLNEYSAVSPRNCVARQTLSYEERPIHLHLLALTSLQGRRRRSGLIMACKTLHGVTDITADSISLQIQSSALM